MELNLDQARRRAKELLRAARARDPEALARLRDDREPRLADAQRAVAQDLGFPSWPELVQHVEASRGDRKQRRTRLVDAALNGRDDIAERLLAYDPSLATAGLDVALVLGDHDAVAKALDADPGLVSRDLNGRRPLSHACHSAFLRPSSARASGVRRVVELLLDPGADVNETFDNEYGAMPVLYGAAGVAHDLADDAAAARSRREPERRRVALPLDGGRGRGVRRAAARPRRHRARDQRARLRDRAAQRRQAPPAARAGRPEAGGPRDRGRAPARRRPRDGADADRARRRPQRARPPRPHAVHARRPLPRSRRPRSCSPRPARAPSSTRRPTTWARSCAASWIARRAIRAEHPDLG